MDHYLRFNALSSFAGFAGVVTEVVTMPIGGTLRAMGVALARRVGRRVLARTSRRFQRVVRNAALRAILRIVIDFSQRVAKAIARRVAELHRQNELRRGFNIATLPINWNQILTVSAREATIGTLNGIWRGIANRQFQAWWTSQIPNPDDIDTSLNLQSPQQVINHFLVEKVIQKVMDAQTFIVDVVSQAFTDDMFDENERTVSQQLNRRVTTRVQSNLESPIQLAFVAVIDNFFSGRTVE
jgi:hypothetical protein